MTDKGSGYALNVFQQENFSGGQLFRKITHPINSRELQTLIWNGSPTLEKIRAGNACSTISAFALLTINTARDASSKDAFATTKLGNIWHHLHVV